MNEHDYALRDAAMAEFVDSYFKARPQLLRTRHEECLVEAGFKAAWKPDQTERAEKADAELEQLREQEPVATLVLSYDGADFEMYYDNNKLRFEGMSMKLYASPIPAPAAQVPQAWRDVMAELAADLQAACDAEYPHREQYPSVMRKYQNDMAIVERARALLQEVKP